MGSVSSRQKSTAALTELPTCATFWEERLSPQRVVSALAVIKLAGSRVRLTTTSTRQTA